MKSVPAPVTDVQPTPAEFDAACLSALADGEADAEGVKRACRLWREDAQARRTWHAYHLIGDVMRSDELAEPSARDAAFLAGIRQRLVDEPPLLAPAPLQAPQPTQGSRPGRRSGPMWLMPAAVAAGFVLVAGVLVVTRTGVPGAPVGGAELSQMATGPAALQRVASGVPVTAVGFAAPATGAAPPLVIRDPRLDEYLRAHQAARGGAVVALPGAGLHRVEAVAPAGAPR